MSLDAATTAKIMGEHQRGAKDTGTPEVQIALMSYRIKELTEHFKVHKKDVHSRRGLLTLVNKRKKLMKYLKRVDASRYSTLIKRLELRDSLQ